MHDRIERPLPLVDRAGDQLNDLAEIVQVGAHERADGVAWRGLVDIEDRVAVGDQILEHGAAELAAAAGDQNFRHCCLLLETAATLARWR